MYIIIINVILPEPETEVVSELISICIIEVSYRDGDTGFGLRLQYRYDTIQDYFAWTSHLSPDGNRNFCSQTLSLPGAKVPIHGTFAPGSENVMELSLIGRKKHYLPHLKTNLCNGLAYGLSMFLQKSQ